MTTITDTMQSTRSLNACTACSSHKRKCDRLIPVCRRCALRNLPCQYGGPVATQNLSLRSLQTVPDLLEPASRWCSPYYFLQFATRARGADELDACLTSCLFSKLREFNIDLDRAITRYVQCVHPWLPIIHPIFLRERAASLRDAPCADSASLALHVLLITPPELTSIIPDNRLTSLYNECKTIFSLMQVSRPDRLATIQSGLLLSIYEHGIGHFSGSYTTLASCASLGVVTGLRQSHTYTSIFDEEKRRVWWAIYLLDRLFYNSDETIDRTFLIQNAQLGDELPADDDLWGRTSDVGPWTPDIPRLSDALDTTIGCFALQVQAVYFLDMVLQSTKSQLATPAGLSELDTHKLDALIRQVTMDTINAFEKDWETLYRAVVIFLLALIELHKGMLMTPSNNGSPASRSESASTATATIEMTLNILHDIVRMDDVLKVQRMPLAAVVLLQKAGSMACWLQISHGRRVEALQPVIESLERAGRRWGVAGEIASQLRIAS